MADDPVAATAKMRTTYGKAGISPVLDRQSLRIMNPYGLVIIADGAFGFMLFLENCKQGLYAIQIAAPPQATNNAHTHRREDQVMPELFARVHIGEMYFDGRQFDRR